MTRPDPRDQELEMLSHDIRSAVSDVIGGLRLLEMQGVDPALREHLAGVQDASEVLARLIEDALVIVSGDNTQPPMSSNLHLSRMLQDKQKRWSIRARRAGAAFEVQRAADLPEVVQLDRLALERVLSNLITNAVKFVGEGTVRLIVDMEDDGTLVFKVEDTGPGFSEAVLSAWDTGHGMPELSSSGMGLGLNISRCHAERLGGQLEIGNRTAGGATCTLRLARRNWQGTSLVTGPLPDLSRYRVLVADDNDTNQLLVSQMLATMGAECEIASDGVEALNWLAREHFDLALIDIEMPRLSGLEVLRAERKRQERGMAPRMALVAMTAYVLRDNRDAIYAAGADGILAKPLVSVESFGHAILHYITAASGQGAPANTDANPAELVCLHEPTLDNLLQVAGPEHADELMLRLRNDLANVETRLMAGLDSDDASQVRAQTHVLISLSSAVGASACHGSARRLNALARGGQDLEAIQTMGEELMDHLQALRGALAEYDVRRQGGTP